MKYKARDYYYYLFVEAAIQCSQTSSGIHLTARCPLYEFAYIFKLKIVSVTENLHKNQWNVKCRNSSFQVVIGALKLFIQIMKKKKQQINLC